MHTDTHTRHEPGIVEEVAPELGVSRWFDASGQPMQEGYGLAQMPGAYKLIFCFQHACPGCHTQGFPLLARMVAAFPRSATVSFAAVQTVFEDFEHNSESNMRADQQRYALPIPFGHDAGEGRVGASSVLMERYRNGGTPWFILIDPSGVVIFNQFRFDADRLIEFLRRAESQAAAPAGDGKTLNWRGVLDLARDGSPAPPRRVGFSLSEWRTRLTPEQFRITREHGTERAHSSEMCALFEPGIYHCVCCETPLFDASSKFDSKSGWPSFTQGLTPDVLSYHADNAHGMQRIEVLCNACDAHLGHVFPDGPAPSGLRYCINAVALQKEKA